MEALQAPNEPLETVARPLVRIYLPLQLGAINSMRKSMLVAGYITVYSASRIVHTL